VKIRRSTVVSALIAVLFVSAIVAISLVAIWLGDKGHVTLPW
jgi:hypothetical protein